MTQTAKLFMIGRSQAVRLLKEFRFEGKEVIISRDPKNLDTNIASHIIRQDEPIILAKAYDLPTRDHAVSAITKGELIFGLANFQFHPKLTKLVRKFLQTITVLPWTDKTAETFGAYKVSCKARGIGLSALDLMIAAHAVSVGATLVSPDKAFAQIGIAWFPKPAPQLGSRRWTERDLISPLDSFSKRRSDRAKTSLKGQYIQCY